MPAFIPIICVHVAGGLFWHTSLELAHQTHIFSHLGILPRDQYDELDRLETPPMIRCGSYQALWRQFLRSTPVTVYWAGDRVGSFRWRRIAPTKPQPIQTRLPLGRECTCARTETGEPLGPWCWEDGDHAGGPVYAPELCP